MYDLCDEEHMNDYRSLYDRNRYSRLVTKFDELRRRDEKALITYAMIRYPSEEAFHAVIDGMLEGGADIIEIGFPFSDPLADGTAIQEASAVSLQNKATFNKFVETVEDLRYYLKMTSLYTPLVLMTYSNILYNIGYKEALTDLRAIEIDGIILPDMSIEESGPYMKWARTMGIDTIFLAAPNTPPDRLQQIIKSTAGFLYLATVYGTTGVRGQADGSSSIPDYAIEAVRRVKRDPNLARLPVGAGFGISGPQDVDAYVKAGADAVIVGSAYTKIIKQAGINNHKNITRRVAKFTRELKEKTLPQ